MCPNTHDLCGGNYVVVDLVLSQCCKLVSTQTLIIQYLTWYTVAFSFFLIAVENPVSTCFASCHICFLFFFSDIVWYSLRHSVAFLLLLDDPSVLHVSGPCSQQHQAQDLRWTG